MKKLEDYLYYEEKDPNLKIYLGDCLEIMPLLQDKSIDMIWTDPPYGHSNHDGDLNARLNDHRGIENKPIANDSQEEFRRVIDGSMREAVRLLKDDCCCCCCCGGGGPSPTFAWVANRLDSDGLEFFHSVIWDKVNPGLGWRYRRQHEMIMVAKKRGSNLLWANKDFATANIISIFPDKKRVHPNEKPLSLVKKFISWHSNQGHLVFDPFLGSGTTLVACKELNRNGIGIEINEKYCEIAKKRLKATCKPLFTDVSGAKKDLQTEMMLGGTPLDAA